MIFSILSEENPLSTLIWLFIIVGAFGVIVLAIVLIKKFVKPLQIDKPEISEEEAAKQELDRVLVPIEDEEIQKQMDDDMKKDAE